MDIYPNISKIRLLITLRRVGIIIVIGDEHQKIQLINQRIIQKDHTKYSDFVYINTSSHKTEKINSSTLKLLLYMKLHPNTTQIYLIQSNYLKLHLVPIVYNLMRITQKGRYQTKVLSRFKYVCETLVSMAAETSQNNRNFSLRDKLQLVVLLGQTKLEKETIFLSI